MVPTKFMSQSSLLLLHKLHIEKLLAGMFDGKLDRHPSYSIELFSPNYPDSYDDNTDISWEIWHEMTGHVIQIEVLEFSVRGKEYYVFGVSQLG